MKCQNLHCDEKADVMCPICHRYFCDDDLFITPEELEKLIPKFLCNECMDEEITRND